MTAAPIPADALAVATEALADAMLVGCGFERATRAALDAYHQALDIDPRAHVLRAELVEMREAHARLIAERDRLQKAVERIAGAPAELPKSTLLAIARWAVYEGRAA